MLLCATLGCSFITVRGPSAPDDPRMAGCSASETAPRFDATVATFSTFLVFVTSLMAAEPCQISHTGDMECSRQHNARLGLLFAVPVSAVFWVSSGYGFRKTGECYQQREASLR